MANPTPTVHRTIEPGITIFSAAELRVAVIPIGELSEDVLQGYVQLITKHRQVDLFNVRSFYKEQQKSPFKFFPWKTGSMHFKYLSEEAALRPSPLGALHTHRKVLGVIGILHCPSAGDMDKAYARFEQMCRAFPEAFLVRCFAFEPNEKQLEAEKKGKPNLIMFPPVTSGGIEQLEGHCEVVMLDTAAGLLAELERWMLAANPALIDLATFADHSEKFLGAAPALDDPSKRLYIDEELVRKRRFGRLQKAMGDHALLAGSPLDAKDHYATAADLASTSTDLLWMAAAMQGLAHAKAMEACMATGAVRGGTKGVGDADSPFGIDPPAGGSSAAGSSEKPPGPAATNKRIASLQAEEASSIASRTSSSGFGGHPFWTALRASDVEKDVRSYMVEALSAVRKRGAVPLQVEMYLQLGRFLAGLKGTRARREVGEMMGWVLDCGPLLALPEDRLLSIMEAAQVAGLVGSWRKRTLLLWQAVELSRSLERPDLATLQIARTALEPPDDPFEQGGAAGGPAGAAAAGAVGGSDAMPMKGHRQLCTTAVPRFWGPVRCGCLEGVMATAILAQQHADVWDSAACLLREHYRDLTLARQRALLDTLQVAAAQMSVPERARPSAGPPPLLTFLRAVPPPPALQPLQKSELGFPATWADEENPFIFTPLLDTAREREGASRRVGPVQWICGETASVEIEIRNPSGVAIKVDRLTLEVDHTPDPSVAPAQAAVVQRQPAWKPSGLAMWLPPETKPTRVTLTGVPLRRGMLALSGCHVSAMGVSWLQPWTPAAPSIGRILAAGLPRAAEAAAATEIGGRAEARVLVVGPLPLLEPRLDLLHGLATPHPANRESRLPKSREESGGREGAIPQPAVALKGQPLDCRLVLTNAGQLPVTSAAVHVVLVTGRASPRNGDSPIARTGAAVQLHVDPAAVSTVLPLLPGRSATVLLHLAAPQVAAYAGEEEARLEVGVEYSSAARGDAPSAGLPATTAAPIDQQLSRRASLALQLLLLPSLQVTSLSFVEHQSTHDAKPEALLPSRGGSIASGGITTSRGEVVQEPAHTESSSPVGQKGQSPTASSWKEQWLARTLSGRQVQLQGQCHIHVEAVNCSDLALEVWLAKKETVDARLQRPAAQSASLKQPLATKLSTRRIASPQQRVATSGPVELPPEVQSAMDLGRMETHAAASTAAGKLPAARREQPQPGRGKSWPSKVQLAAAEGICDAYVLCFRRLDDDQGQVSELPLMPDVVRRALTPVALDLLLDHSLQLQFAARLLGDGPPRSLPRRQLALMGPGAPSGRGAGPVWGVEVPVGRPVEVTVQARNGTAEAVVMRLSLACADAEAQGAGDVGPPAQLLCSGVTAGVELEVGPGGMAGHRIAACFLQPGLNQLRAFDVSCNTGARSADVDGQVSPLHQRHDPRMQLPVSMMPLTILVV